MPFQRIALASLLLVMACSHDSAPVRLSVGPAPWPVPSNAHARIVAAGLPAPSSEKLDYHEHAHLDVFVDGVSQPVPAGIGIDGDKHVISPLHTHYPDGVLHFESEKPATFTLGELFTEWGVRLDAQCVGSYCTPAVPIRLHVNGVERPGDPRDLPLGHHDEVALVIGTPPAEVPSAFAFASNL